MAPDVPMEDAHSFPPSSKGQVRLIRDFILLPTFEQLYSMLDISMRNVWESGRKLHPGLPVYKTVAKIFEWGDFQPRSKGVEEKLLRNLPARESAKQLDQALLAQGFCMPAASGWASLFEKNLFSSRIASEYWLNVVRELAILNGPVFRGLSPGLSRLRAYAESELLARFGCPFSRELLAVKLPQLDDTFDIESSADLEQLMACDRIAALLRVAAWAMADWQTEYWELTVQDGLENTVMCRSMIPRYSAATGTWSAPVEVAVERLAEMAGWRRKQLPVTYLGKFWGGSDGAESKTRLLRNWVQLRPGRPSFAMLVDLVRKCRIEEARLQGIEVGDWEADHWFSASIFRVAETLSRMVRGLEQMGYPPELVNSAMGVYESEYRAARGLLGRPFTD